MRNLLRPVKKNAEHVKKNAEPVKKNAEHVQMFKKNIWPDPHATLPYLPPPYVGYRLPNMQDASNVLVNGGLATSLY